MSEVKQIVDELKRIYDGDAWHGPSLVEALAGISAEQALAKLMPAAHSIWELALHIAAWEDVFNLRLKGHSISEPEEGDFPPVDNVSEEAWTQMLARLEIAHEELIKLVSELPDSKLGETVAGKDYSVEFMLRGAIRHLVYHSGQIALLKKA